MSNVLIHIGFPKSGSTYLQEWLAKHPDIYFQPKHFAQGFYNAWELARFAQHAKEVPENFVLSCEDLTLWKSEPEIYGLRGTLSYDYRRFQDNVSQILYGLFPAAKILIVTRSHREILRSIYAQYVFMGGTLSFKDLTDENFEMFSTMLDYTYVIKHYREKFGEKHVTVLPYELLRDEPQKFLSTIEKELHIEKRFQFSDKKINAAMEAKMLASYRAVSLFVYAVLKPFPSALQKKIYGNYCKAIRRKKPHPFIQKISPFIKDKIDWSGLNELTNSFKHKAEILKEIELYSPYLIEYFTE